MGITQHCPTKNTTGISWSKVERSLLNHLANPAAQKHQPHENNSWKAFFQPILNSQWCRVHVPPRPSLPLCHINIWKQLRYHVGLFLLYPPCTPRKLLTSTVVYFQLMILTPIRLCAMSLSVFEGGYLAKGISHTKITLSSIWLTVLVCHSLQNSQTCLLLCCVSALPGVGCLWSGTEEQEIQLVLSGTIGVGFALGFLQLVTTTGGCIQPPKSSFEAELGKDFQGINPIFLV